MRKVPLSLERQGSGVARGLLQGRPLQLPMGWGVGEELTKSWPTFEQLCVQNLAWAISYCCLPPKARTKSGWLEVDQELDMGCQLLTRTFPCWNCRGLSCCSPLATLVALYRAMRLRSGYGFESTCDANGPWNVKNTNPAKHRAVVLPPLLLVGNKELVLKVPKRGQFHAAIRVTIWRCDLCAQGALGRGTVSRRNFCDAESLAKRCGETCH